MCNCSLKTPSTIPVFAAAQESWLVTPAWEGGRELFQGMGISFFPTESCPGTASSAEQV